ncbi:uncharacterized protein DUF4760 [Roseibium hamelinense]|uniref:Uncharacterized protein DUF4760 n=1 Tax=Roseibium hamelinense TaxID=150831 RepID=A0A562T751_9HYPH|nr:DUF4760 domain-containing protein [Roseibium hamelinense]MTI43686.1 DUF4760 domain-containing protein [Roseibium hamelinense]TWI89365.1 uncharacterized protein DUF4760 [Roseibium hamelinense]
MSVIKGESVFGVLPISTTIEAIVISTAVAVVAIIVTLIGIAVSRAASTKTFTIQTIITAESDKELLDAQAAFNTCAKAGNIAQYAEAHQHASNQSEQIRRTLNHLELLAIGVHTGALNFSIFKRWYENGLIHQWEQAESFVVQLRSVTGRKELYRDLELLYNILIGRQRRPVWLKRHLSRWF